MYVFAIAVISALHFIEKTEKHKRRIAVPLYILYPYLNKVMVALDCQK